ncbi:MAG: phosphoribosylglycinamide formyltransferase [Lachnospiraceae bacterium]|nr:phosphoribosylglycinamide formyltransferase [Lachnospiraceae bacterium]
MSEKKRIAVLVSGGGTNLQAIIDAQKSGIIKSGEVVLVLSNNENAYALERAKNAGIKTITVKRSAYTEGQIFKAMMDEKIDLIVLAGFMTVLSEEFTREFPRRILNVHPSLIPSFCGKGYYGLKVHEEALKKGVKVTGATVHFVNEIPDGGEIIFQKAVEVADDDTPETLQRKVMEQAEWILLPRAIEKVCSEMA